MQAKLEAPARFEVIAPEDPTSALLLNGGTQCMSRSPQESLCLVATSSTSVSFRRSAYGEAWVGVINYSSRVPSVVFLCLSDGRILRGNTERLEPVASQNSSQPVDLVTVQLNEAAQCVTFEMSSGMRSQYLLPEHKSDGWRFAARLCSFGASVSIAPEASVVATPMARAQHTQPGKINVKMELATESSNGGGGITELTGGGRMSAEERTQYARVKLEEVQKTINAIRESTRFKGKTEVKSEIIHEQKGGSVASRAVPRTPGSLSSQSIPWTPGSPSPYTPHTVPWTPGSISSQTVPRTPGSFSSLPPTPAGSHNSSGPKIRPIDYFERRVLQSIGVVRKNRYRDDDLVRKGIALQMGLVFKDLDHRKVNLPCDAIQTTFTHLFKTTSSSTHRGDVFSAFSDVCAFLRQRGHRGRVVQMAHKFLNEIKGQRTSWKWKEAVRYQSYCQEPDLSDGPNGLWSAADDFCAEELGKRHRWRAFLRSWGQEITSKLGSSDSEDLQADSSSESSSSGLKRPTKRPRNLRSTRAGATAHEMADISIIKERAAAPTVPGHPLVASLRQPSTQQPQTPSKQLPRHQQPPLKQERRLKLPVKQEQATESAKTGAAPQVFKQSPEKLRRVQPPPQRPKQDLEKNFIREFFNDLSVKAELSQQSATPHPGHHRVAAVSTDAQEGSVAGFEHLPTSWMQHVPEACPEYQSEPYAPQLDAAGASSSPEYQNESGEPEQFALEPETRHRHEHQETQQLQSASEGQQPSRGWETSHDSHAMASDEHTDEERWQQVHDLLSDVLKEAKATKQPLKDILAESADHDQLSEQGDWWEDSIMSEPAPWWSERLQAASTTEILPLDSPASRLQDKPTTQQAVVAQEIAATPSAGLDADDGASDTDVVESDPETEPAALRPRSLSPEVDTDTLMARWHRVAKAAESNNFHHGRTTSNPQVDSDATRARSVSPEVDADALRARWQRVAKVWQANFQEPSSQQSVTLDPQLDLEQRLQKLRDFSG